MVELHGMDRTRSPSDQEICCVGASILIVDSIANVVRQQVLNFDRRSQSQIQLRVLPGHISCISETYRVLFRRCVETHFVPGSFLSKRLAA